LVIVLKKKMSYNKDILKVENRNSKMALTKQNPVQHITGQFKNYRDLQGYVTPLFGGAYTVAWGPVNTAVGIAVGTVCHYANIDLTKAPRVVSHGVTLAEDLAAKAIVAGGTIKGLQTVKRIAKNGVNVKGHNISIQNFVDAHTPKK
jgi:hypothetical protein